MPRDPRTTAIHPVPLGGARVTISVWIPRTDGGKLGKSAGTTLTLSACDLRAIGFKMQEDPSVDEENIPTDEPATVDDVIAYLAAVIDNGVDFAVQNYHDAGGKRDE